MDVLNWSLESEQFDAALPSLHTPPFGLMLSYPGIKIAPSFNFRINVVFIPTLSRALACDPAILCAHFDVAIVLATYKTPEWVWGLKKSMPVECIEYVALDAGFKEFLSCKSSCNPSMQASLSYDLPYKRNLALKICRQRGYSTALFLDDDIKLRADSIRLACYWLEHGYSIIGCYSIAFPDVSSIDHVERRIRRSPSLISISGNCLFLRVSDVVGFFPYLYNEDWVFMFCNKHHMRIGACGVVTHGFHEPWLNDNRVRFEQFGEVVAAAIKSTKMSQCDLSSFDEKKWALVLSAYIGRLNELERNASCSVYIKAIRVAITEALRFHPSEFVEFVSSYDEEVRNGIHE